MIILLSCLLGVAIIAILIQRQTIGKLRQRSALLYAQNMSMIEDSNKPGYHSTNLHE